MALISQVGRILVACAAMLTLATCNWDYGARYNTRRALMPASPLAASVAVRPSEAPPAVEPVAFASLTPEQAILRNAGAIGDPGPAARSFSLGRGADHDRAVECLATAIYYEAASEPVQGQRAVAQVVLNRLRHPAFPKTVCGVVYQGATRSSGCQFTFTCDGSMTVAPVPRLWIGVRAVALAALDGTVEPGVGMATHYHANRVVPYWAETLTRAATIGSHIFYRWNGFWGTPAAFTGHHARHEPAIADLLGVSREAPAPPSRPVAARSPRLAPAILLDDVEVTANLPLRTLRADLEAGRLNKVLERSAPLEADRHKPQLILDAPRASPVR